MKPNDEQLLAMLTRLAADPMKPLDLRRWFTGDQLHELERCWVDCEAARYASMRAEIAAYDALVASVPPGKPK